MTAIPAIDLIDGRCVRLTEGRFDSVRVYNEDPVETAKSFAGAGARRLHVVDLDAARGQGDNRRSIALIRRAFPGIIDVGGGVRKSKDAENLLDIGIDLIVVGTSLAENPEEVGEWTADFGQVFIAGIDARDGMVKTSGWEEGSVLRAVDLAVTAGELGLIEIIYTDIARDGTMKGPNISETETIAAASGLPVIISGGVGSMADLKAMTTNLSRGITGVIFGKALYEGTIDLCEAIKTLGGSE